MDPFARGDGRDHGEPCHAAGEPEADERQDRQSPAGGPPADAAAPGAAPSDPGREGASDAAPAGLGDPPPDWSEYYTYPSAGYTTSSTRGTYGRPRPDYTPYVDPGYPPPGYWAAPPAPRRGSRAALVAIAIIACCALLVAGVGSGVRAALYLRNRTTPTAGRAPGKSGSGTGSIDLQGLAAKLDPSIVDITGVKEDADGQTVEDDAGTGVIISRNGQVLTNNHVIEDDDQLQATVADGHTYPIQILGEDPTDDVALVQIQGLTDLPSIELARGVAASMNEAVAAFGNALGRGGRPAATQGQVTNLDQTITATLDNNSQRTETLSGLIEMSAQICPGDSGGMLADARGRDLGIVTAASSGPSPAAGPPGSNGPPGYGGGGGPAGGGTTGQDQCSNDGFVIPVAQAIPIVQQIRSGRRSAKIIIGVPGFLGVEVEECTETSAEQGSCQAPAVNGAQITDLVEGGAAEQAGLPQSFVITGIDQAQVTDPSDLTTVLEQTSPGQAVQVTWNDGQGGSTQTTTVTLGAGPPA